VDDDVSEARKILKTVQETCLTEILQAQREAVSMLLQVLYSLHQGHVLFLMGDYRTRVLDIHGSDAALSPKGFRVRAWLPLCTLGTFALLLTTPSKKKSICPKKATPRIPKTQVRLLITPMVAKKTRLTPPSLLPTDESYTVPVGNVNAF
jgi:hypothetical protein